MIEAASQRSGNQPKPNGREPDFSEDDLAQSELGGTTGRNQPVGDRMTPQRRKKTPKDVDPGHTA
jgi:hypothetical protein